MVILYPVWPRKEFMGTLDMDWFRVRQLDALREMYKLKKKDRHTYSDHIHDIVIPLQWKIEATKIDT